WLGAVFSLHCSATPIRCVSCKIFRHVLLGYRRGILRTRQIVRVLRSCNRFGWIHPERTYAQAFGSSQRLLCYSAVLPNSPSGFLSILHPQTEAAGMQWVAQPMHPRRGTIPAAKRCGGVPKARSLD